MQQTNKAHLQFMICQFREFRSICVEAVEQVNMVGKVNNIPEEISFVFKQNLSCIVRFSWQSQFAVMNTSIIYATVIHKICFGIQFSNLQVLDDVQQVVKLNQILLLEKV